MILKVLVAQMKEYKGFMAYILKPYDPSGKMVTSLTVSTRHSEFKQPGYFIVVLVIF